MILYLYRKERGVVARKQSINYRCSVHTILRQKSYTFDEGIFFPKVVFACMMKVWIRVHPRSSPLCRHVKKYIYNICTMYIHTYIMTLCMYVISVNCQCLKYQTYVYTITHYTLLVYTQYTHPGTTQQYFLHLFFSPCMYKNL